MSLRKWLLRLLAFLLLLLCSGGYYVVQRWTNPRIVRELVLEALGARLPGVEVRLARAELRFLGGISLYELRGSLREHPEHDSFAVLPETVIYPDKERLTRGELGLRKIQFKRPTLSVIRQRDGSWNLQALRICGSTTKLNDLPPIAIEDATITLQDLTCAAPPLKLHGVNLDLLPVGSASYDVVGEGELDLLGPVRFRGQVNVETGQGRLAVSLVHLVLSNELFERLNRHWPNLKPAELDLQGQFEVHLDLLINAKADDFCSCQARGRFSQGRVAHPRLPGVAENLEGFWTFAGQRLRLESAHGDFLAGKFELQGEATTNGDLTCKLKGQRWVLSPKVYTKLPPELTRLCREYQPQGRLNGSADLSYVGGKLGFSYSAQPDGLEILFEDLPYPVTNVKGSIEYHEPAGAPQMTMYLTGTASGQPVQLRGRLFGAGLRPDNDLKCGFDLELAGEHLPIDRQLEDGLAPYPFTARTLRQFHASGHFGFNAKLSRSAGSAPGVRPPLQKHIVVHAQNLAFKFDEFPYPMEQGQVTLTIRTDNSWAFDHLSAARHHGWIFGKGQMTPTERGDELHAELRLANVPLEEPLREAMPAEAQEAWDQLRPSGRVDGDVVIDQVIGKEPARIDLTVRPRSCSVKPQFLPCLFTDVQGSVRYQDRLITIDQLTARHKAATLRIDRGKVDLGPGERIQAELLPLTIDGLLIDEEVREAVARLPRQTLEALRPSKPLNACLNLVLRREQAGQNWKCGWNGVVNLKQCGIQAGLDIEDATGRVTLQGLYDGRQVQNWGKVHLTHATILKQPLTNLKVDLLATDQEVKLTGGQAQLHGGQLLAEVDVKLRDPMVYETRVRADDVDLGQVVQHAQDKYSSVRGKLSAGMTLFGRGKEVGTLKGSGWMKVDSGAHLCELPVVLEIANHLHRLLPRATSFQDASALVRLEGDNLDIQRFDLVSDALSLRGQGRVKLDGSDMNLELFGIPYGRTLPSLPPILDRIPPTLSKQFLRIRATGNLSDLRIHTEPLPSLVDPVKDMLRTFGEQPTQTDAAPRSSGFDPGPPPALQSPK